MGRAIFPWLTMKSLIHSRPEFFIVGAQKCGTTSLYNYLIRHPYVLGASIKEIHFFSDHYEKGYGWYKCHFPSLFRKYRRVLSGRHKVITGEATPFYIFHPHAPERIKNSYPQARIIMMFRNPVDRAYSHYRYHVKLGAETLTFEEAIEAESERLKGELDKMITDKHYNSYNYKMFSYLKRGIYIEQLKRWIDLFPREQILIVRSEDFFDDPASCFGRVQKFLGLPQHTLASYETFNVGKEVSMDQKTRERLVSYFSPYNKSLYECLDTDFDWNK